MLECNNISAAYGKIQTIFNISFTVPDNSIVSIIGANGAGKSTILKTISGLLKPIKGEIFFNKEKINGKSPKDIVSLGIAHVPEGRNIFPGLTVVENLLTGCVIRKLDKVTIKNEMEKVFNLFPRLKERKNQLGWSLSGGEQQMLAIGRGLMSNPKILLFDEPSLGLAPILVEKIFEIIVEISKKGTSILLVEQNANLALEVSQLSYVLENGHIVMAGKSSDLLKNPNVRKVYLGMRKN